MRRLAVCTAIITITAAATTAPAAYGSPGSGPTAKYGVTDLGTLGGTFSGPIDIDTRGEVTGVSTNVGDTALRGFIWRRGVLTDLGTLGGPQGAGAGINSSGQVEGWSDLTARVGPSIFNQTSLFCNPPMVVGQPTVACRATLWENGKLTDLGTLGGQNSAGQNKGINEQGQVVGQAETAAADPTGTKGSLKFHAFVWQRETGRKSQRGRMIDLGTLGNDPDSLAAGINDRGQVVGMSIKNGAAFAGDNGYGFLWQHGVMTPLGTLGGEFSAPAAINNRGQVVGHASTPRNRTMHATMWYQGRTLDLGTLPGDVFSEASDITDDGQIFGISCSSAGCRATTWNASDVIDLNTQISPDSGWHLDDAQAGNLNGQIVGDGGHDGLPHAYLLDRAH